LHDKTPGPEDSQKSYKLFRTIAKEAELPGRKAASPNVNLVLVKQQLGHKSIGSTIRYVTMSDQQASKATATALMKIY
jgi:hypothetical protein